MDSGTIRKKFFDFFVERGHTHVASSSLIPAQDPTLLFTNAGMNQFKDVFLGKEKRSYTRAVTIQKCIRAGGKHNDLENVGFTKRHLTFFEMMGNFSFGDYFKNEAIRFAWDFLTKEIGLRADKLYASVYYLDDEAYDIWHETIGLPTERIVRLGAADNFWQMGDTGPCGPCTEIYIDRGLTFGCNGAECAPGCHCDRFLEIWNLVFMQFDRQLDGTDKPLLQKGVDTGMGLERLCAVVQKKDSVFEIDLFAPLLSRIEQLTAISYKSASPEIQAAFRVLADHIRSSCFAIADGCTPANDGRGYVLRKIIRRAALFAQKLSAEKNIFPEIAPALIELMSPLYPELKTNATSIIALLRSEVEKFSHNLVNGQQILEKYFTENRQTKTISGSQAFKLYDTYGFPLELTKVIAHERGFTVDTKEFENEMEQQRKQSGKKLTQQTACILDETISTLFTGYDEHTTLTTITALVVDNTQMLEVSAGTLCKVVTAHSPFYVECGGQISDEGLIKVQDKQAKLLGLEKIGNAIAVLIEAPIDLHIGDTITLAVDTPTRINSMKNHTATHLLQAALMMIIGKTVKQSGSVVTPDYFRFDFTHHENLTAEQVILIEDLVNKKIMENIPVLTTQTTYKDAVSRGVIAFFGEKYNPENVRVVEVPGFSAELCGGTHVQATGDIGVFKITEVSSLSAGNRRVVALTGPAALRLFQETFTTVKHLSQEFKVTQSEVSDAVARHKEQYKEAQALIKDLKKQLNKLQLPSLLEQVEQVDGQPFLFKVFSDSSQEELKDMATALNRIKPGFYFFAYPQEERTNFLVMLDPQYINRLNLKSFASWLKEQGLQGGGGTTSLQGSVLKLAPDLSGNIKLWIKKQLGLK